MNLQGKIWAGLFSLVAAVALGGIGCGDMDTGGDPFLELERAEFDTAEEATGELDPTQVEPVFVKPGLGVKILWGHIKLDPTSLKESLWKARLYTTGGMVIRKWRTVLFEPGDEVVSASETELVVNSTIYGHHDGLLVWLDLEPSIVDGTVQLPFCELLDDTTGSTDCISLPSLTFESEQFSHTWHAHELLHINQLYPAGDEEFFIHSLRFPFCGPSGFTFGGFGAGVFGGPWLRWNGSLIGKLTGEYGRSPDGRRWVKGKVKTPDGALWAWLWGTWYPFRDLRACDVSTTDERCIYPRPGGMVDARLLRFNGHRWKRGRLRAYYRKGNVPWGIAESNAALTSERPPEGAGFFAGRWWFHCPKLTAEPIP